MKILISALVLFLSFTVQANPLVFDCSVKDFVNLSGLDKDEFFVQSNLKKRFIISVDEDEIIATFSNGDDSSGVSKFQIYTRLGSTVRAIERVGLGSIIYSIVINEIIGEATISYQTTNSLSVWLLDCQKQ